GISTTDPRRVRALVSHALHEKCAREGHMYLTFDQFAQGFAQLERQISARDALAIAMQSNAKLLHVDEEHGEERLYDYGLWHAEQKLARELAARMQQDVEPLLDCDPDTLDTLIDHAQHQVAERKGLVDFSLDASQRAALIGILTSANS